MDGIQKIQSGLKVGKELKQAQDFLLEARRDGNKTATLVVASNHDEALNRWLQETDWRQDLANAEIYLELNWAALSAARRKRPFNPTEEGIGGVAGVKFLSRDESYVVGKQFSGGVELAMHGDLGANGRPGSPLAFAATGRKSIVGHSHSASWTDGCLQVGVTGNLDMDYNRGLSAWSHTNALVYPNGKRALFTIYKGKWRA